MGKAAYEFADFVRACNHKYWQVLPIGSTTYGDSPYQSYSAFAGNPYFIDLDMLAEDGLLLKSDMLAVDWGDGKVPVHISEEEAGNGNFTQNTDIGLGNECYVSYEKMYQNRFAVLRKAFESYKAVRSESKVKLVAGLPEYKKYDNFIRIMQTGLKIMRCLWRLKSILTVLCGRNGTRISVSGPKKD